MVEGMVGDSHGWWGWWETHTEEGGDGGGLAQIVGMVRNSHGWRGWGGLAWMVGMVGDSHRRWLGTHADVKDGGELAWIVGMVGDSHRRWWGWGGLAQMGLAQTADRLCKLNMFMAGQFFIAIANRISLPFTSSLTGNRGIPSSN